MIRLALLGRPGTGKNTFVSLAGEWARSRDVDIEVIVLAAPLYAAQAAVYRLCGKPLDSDAQQDGALLNFLGAHMRKINPAVLEEHFLLELARVMATPADGRRRLLICADARPADVTYLRREQFRTIELCVSPERARSRRVVRGDLTLGSADHETETGLRAEDVDTTVDNDGSMEEFSVRVHRLLDAFAT